MDIAYTTTAFYIVAAGLWLLGLKQARPWSSTGACVLGSVAWFLHAWLLYQWIDLPNLGLTNNVQNLYINNVFSLIVWFAILLVSLVTTKKPQLYHVAAMLFPVAAGSILWVTLLPGTHLLTTGDNVRQLLHVLFAVATFSVLSIATMLAVLVGVQDYLLRRKQVGRMSRYLPPLETMEHILFVFIWIGFIGLTITLLGSFIAAANAKTHSPYLALTAWIVFLVLLLGRWRGRNMIVWTFAGVFLLILSYFGSWFLTA